MNKTIVGYAVIGKKGIFVLRDRDGGSVKGFSVFETRKMAQRWYDGFFSPNKFRIIPVTVTMDLSTGKTLKNP